MNRLSDFARVLRFFVPALVLGTCPLIGCGSNEVHYTEGLIKDAPCVVKIERAEPLVTRTHVCIPSNVAYTSNPPSIGPHYRNWAAYQTFPFEQPVDRRNYVHNLEHGAIVFLYKCDAPEGCPEVVSALEQVVDSLPDDPGCVRLEQSAPVRVKTVITNDQEIEGPIAAAAWGWTYKAECADMAGLAPSLKLFAKEHYGHGPETTCGNGVTKFSVCQDPCPEAAAACAPKLDGGVDGAIDGSVDGSGEASVADGG